MPSGIRSGGMICDIAPDWSMVKTPPQAEAEFVGFKWHGPGWYVLANGQTFLVTPLKKTNSPWKRAWPVGAKFIFASYAANPRAAFNAVVNAPTRRDERSDTNAREASETSGEEGSEIPLFMLSLLNQADAPDSETVRAELEEGNFAKFVARFVNGLVHQGSMQTGSSRPIGETTAIRIAHELMALMNTAESDFDWQQFHMDLRLDGMKEKT